MAQGKHRTVEIDRIKAVSQRSLQDAANELELPVYAAVFSPDRLSGVVACGAEPESRFSYHLRSGHVFYLHTSGPGKALLAWLPEDEREDTVNRIELRRFNDNTLTTPKALLADLELSVKRGFAVDISEEIQNCHCVGVPILADDQYPLAALWTTAPSEELSEEMFEDVAAKLWRLSMEISAGLKATEGESSSRALVQEAIGYVEANIEAPAIDFEAFAKEHKVSYSWFRKAFKRETGDSPNQYRLMKRVEEAQRLLRQTDLNIREISEKLNFESQNYFSSFFTRKAGMSPQEYRRSCRR